MVQAVECAVVLQAALEDRNRDVPEDQAIHARIGINLGEVIVDGDDRYGEGVNIARGWNTGRTGGICVSDKVAREGGAEARLRLCPDGAAEGEEHRRAGDGVPGEPTAGRAPRAGGAGTATLDHGGWSSADAVAMAAVAMFFLRPLPDGPPPREGPLSVLVLRFAT